MAHCLECKEKSGFGPAQVTGRLTSGNAQQVYGAPGQNGIMCGFDQSFERASECTKDEWCTGPYNITTAVLGSSQLCKKGARNEMIYFETL